MNLERRDFLFIYFFNKPGSADTLTPVWKIPLPVLSLGAENSSKTLHFAEMSAFGSSVCRVAAEPENSFVNGANLTLSFKPRRRTSLQ